jgi:hypothetical protein
MNKLEDLEVYIYILQEVKILFDTSSHELPPSVNAALKICISREKQLEQTLLSQHAHLERVDLPKITAMPKTFPRSEVLSGE